MHCFHEFKLYVYEAFISRALFYNISYHGTSIYRALLKTLPLFGDDGKYVNICMIDVGDSMGFLKKTCSMR